MTKAELKTAAIAIRVRPSLKAALELMAEQDRRSLASFVEGVLEDHVNAHMNKGLPGRKPRK